MGRHHATGAADKPQAMAGVREFFTALKILLFDVSANAVFAGTIGLRAIGARLGRELIEPAVSLDFMPEQAFHRHLAVA